MSPKLAAAILTVACLILVPVAQAREVHVGIESPMRYLANVSDPGVGLLWTEDDFDDSTWRVGAYGVGYDNGEGARDLLRDVVSNRTFSVYTRAKFTISSVSQLSGVYFGADYDDGVVAWLNGVEVFRSPEMPPGPLTWRTNTTEQKESSNGVVPNYRPFADITQQGLGALRNGENTLAVGVWNFNAPSSSDLVLVPVLVTQEDAAVEWETRLNFQREGRVVRPAGDGHTVVAGVIEPAASQEDGYLARFDAGGSLLWERAYGNDGDEWFDLLEVVSDGGFAVAGGRAPNRFADPADVLLVRADEEGSVIWEATFGGDDWEVADSLRVTETGGFLISGHCHGAEAACRVFVLEVSVDGRLTRRKESEVEQPPWTTQLTRDGGLVLAYVHGALTRIDAAGNVIWRRDAVPTATFWSSVRETDDGGFVMGGSTPRESIEIRPRVFGALGGDAALLRVDASGALLWSHTYGREGRQSEFVESIELAADGGFLLIGSSGFFADGGLGSDVYVLSLDGNGEIRRETRLGFEFREPAVLSPARGRAAWPTADGGFIACGDALGFYLAKVLPETGSETFFQRGDVNADGRLSIVDAIRILFVLFHDTSGIGCHQSADVDDNGVIGIADAIGLLGYLFLRGAAPTPPFPACGTDLTSDSLSCVSFPACE